MDSIADGVLDLLYAAGIGLMADDYEDIANPKAHQGIHHYHIGALLTNLSSIIRYSDMMHSLIPKTTTDVLKDVELMLNKL